MKRLMPAFLALVLALVLAAGGWSPPASAQMSVEDRCRNATGGLVLSMNTQRQIGRTRDVALEHSGLKPGGPRYLIADDAYRQLAAAVPLEAVLERARARCRQVGPDALEDDEPTFNGTREPDGGGGPQLCAAVASTIAAQVAEDPVLRRMPVDDAVREVQRDDPREMARPQLRRILQITLARAAVRADEQELQELIFRHCDGLDTAAREALERELYEP